MSSRVKRYDDVVQPSESSSDEEYEPNERAYNKNSDKSYENTDYEDDCDRKILKKADTSSSSYDITMSKRGRGHSRRPCMNKNAQAARENRIRKKKHLEQVENKLSFYQQKNKSLVNVIQRQDIDIKKLKGEVAYLRCILKNNTNITALLRSMNEGLSKTPKTTKLKNVTTPNRRILQTVKNGQKAQNRLQSEFDHTYTIPKTQSATEKKNGVVDDVENLRNPVFDDEISLDFEKEELPTSVFNHSNKLFNDNMSDTEMMDEWSRLNVNIYDNFTSFDDVLSPADNLENFTNLYNDSNVLEQFRDAGICLHVNSNKVSLEFCSICHMNSLNSPPE